MTAWYSCTFLLLFNGGTIGYYCVCCGSIESKMVQLDSQAGARSALLLGHCFKYYVACCVFRVFVVRCFVLQVASRYHKSYVHQRYEQAVLISKSLPRLNIVFPAFQLFILDFRNASCLEE